MSSLLVFSPRCDHSRETIEFIGKHPQLKAMPFRYHDIHKSPLPQQLRTRVTRVPTLITKDRVLVGQEIKAFLASLLPNEAPVHCELGGTCGMSSIDGNDDDGDLFSLDSYGVSLQPAMTPELEAKIQQQVEQVAYSDITKDT